MTMLFAGSSHPSLAKKLASKAKIPLGKVQLDQFPDGEFLVDIEEDVQGKEIFVFQSLAHRPHDYLMELLIMVDALKRASAKKITAIVPYLSYCRQDRKTAPGSPISAKLVANFFVTAGVDHLIVIDIHSEQVEGFFDIPVEPLHCQEMLSEAAKQYLSRDCIVVAPDVGGIKMAERVARYLGIKFVLMKKERSNAYDVKVALVGEVKGKDVFIIDDMCSTAGTLVAAASLCRSSGAKKIIAAVTHGLFTKEALKKIEESPIERLFITDTVSQKSFLPSKVEVLSVIPLLSCSINCSESENS